MEGTADGQQAIAASSTTFVTTATAILGFFIFPGLAQAVLWGRDADTHLMQECTQNRMGEAPQGQNRDQDESRQEGRQTDDRGSRQETSANGNESEERQDDGASEDSGPGLDARIAEVMVVAALATIPIAVLIGDAQDLEYRTKIGAGAALFVLVGGVDLRFPEYMAENWHVGMTADPAITRVAGLGTYLLGVFAIYIIIVP